MFTSVVVCLHVLLKKTSVFTYNFYVYENKPKVHLFNMSELKKRVREEESEVQSNKKICVETTRSILQTFTPKPILTWYQKQMCDKNLSVFLTIAAHQYEIDVEKKYDPSNAPKHYARIANTALKEEFKVSTWLQKAKNLFKTLYGADKYNFHWDLGNLFFDVAKSKRRYLGVPFLELTETLQMFATQLNITFQLYGVQQPPVKKTKELYQFEVGYKEIVSPGTVTEDTTTCHAIVILDGAQAHMCYISTLAHPLQTTDQFLAGELACSKCNRRFERKSTLEEHLQKPVCAPERKSKRPTVPPAFSPLPGKDCIMFFDLETTGLVKFSDTVYQLAWTLTSCTNEIISQEVFYINGATQVDNIQFNPNQVDIQEVQTAGVTEEEAVRRFLQAAERVFLFVSHNTSFDFGWLDTLPGMDIQLFQEKSFCTCSNGKNVSVWTDARGYRKRPRLDELYQFLFPDQPLPDKMHSANVDVEMTRQCFFKAFASSVLVVE